jgi:Uma2 family endonuclease
VFSSNDARFSYTEIMAQPAPEHRMSIAQYLEFEEGSPVKHEFADGKLFAMAGSSDEHNTISASFVSLLREAVRGGPCRAFNSDMKVLTNQVFYYPDAMVSCDERDTKVTPQNRFYKSHPCLIVEVLSPSTEKIDRGEKLHNYRLIPELETYIIADQTRARLEVYQRGAGELWTYRVLEHDGVLELAHPAIRLRVTDAYEGVEFPPLEPSRSAIPELEQ